MTLKPFLITFVVDNPMVPFLYDDLFEVIKNVKFINVKSDFNKYQFLLRLFEIVSAKNMNIRFVASTHIENLVKRIRFHKQFLLIPVYMRKYLLLLQ